LQAAAAEIARRAAEEQSAGQAQLQAAEAEALIHVAQVAREEGRRQELLKERLVAAGAGSSSGSPSAGAGRGDAGRGRSRGGGGSAGAGAGARAGTAGASSAKTGEPPKVLALSAHRLLQLERAAFQGLLLADADAAASRRARFFAEHWPVVAAFASGGGGKGRGPAAAAAPDEDCAMAAAGGEAGTDAESGAESGAEAADGAGAAQQQMVSRAPPAIAAVLEAPAEVPVPRAAAGAAPAEAVRECLSSMAACLQAVWVVCGGLPAGNSSSAKPRKLPAGTAERAAAAALALHRYRAAEGAPAATLAEAQAAAAAAEAEVVPPLPAVPQVHAQLRPYQKAGVAWLIQRLYRNGVSAILADEMGLGKTLQTITFLATLKYAPEFKVGGPHLVLAPLSVLNSWMTEFRRWCPGLRVMRLHATESGERERLKTKLLAGVHAASAEAAGQGDGEGAIDVVVTTYDMLKAAGFTRTLTSRVRWRYVVFDEGHVLKSEKTAVSAAARKLRREAVLLLTGTPLQNNMHELWAVLNMLHGDVFPRSAAFDDAFNLSADGAGVPSSAAGDGTAGSAGSSSITKGGGRVDVGMLARAHRLLRPFVLRRVKTDPLVAADLGLGSKLETKVFCALSRQQLLWYQRLLLSLGGQGGGGGGGGSWGHSDQAKKMQSLMMQLRKVSLF
jgi:hypothetical protein